ncbi:MAG: hypothetical protein MJK10_01160 [Pseudomonadales bacterium]|nr:hypothetical protein [Pseudomonadales bacterium]NRA14484.1 hypothetical protein [Oceanospirillaceae bacterium]
MHAQEATAEGNGLSLLPLKNVASAGWLIFFCIPPALVNLLLLTASGSASGLPLGHKPAFAIGISASAGGSNPISLLKGYAAKNSHLTWLPLHAIIQNVGGRA